MYTTTKHKSNNRSLDQHYRSTEPHIHIQNTPANTSRKHILLKHTWNILPDRPHVSLKTNINNPLKTEIIKTIFSNQNKMKLETNNRRKMEKSTKCGN